MSETPALAEELLRAIRRIVRRISDHSRRLSQEVGLTLPQLLVLRAIGRLDEEAELTLARVSREVQLSAATVSRIVDRLERAGLVARERKAADRRKVCLSLTPAGVDRFQALPTPLQERFVARLGELSEGESQALLDALQRVLTMMEEPDAEEVEVAPMLAPGLDPGSEQLD